MVASRARRRIAPRSHADEARQAYLEEGTPLRPSGSVDIRRAVWLPPLAE